MNKKNRYFRATIEMWLIALLAFLFIEITFAYQNYDLDEFGDLEKKSLDEQKKKSNNNDNQKLILLDDNLYLLNNDFDFGKEELELLKLELNPDDIELSKEYEDFLNDFFEHSTLLGQKSFNKSIPPIKEQEESDSLPKKKTEDIKPVDSSSFEKSIPPIKEQEESNSLPKNKTVDIKPEDSSVLKTRDITNGSPHITDERSISPPIKQDKPKPPATTLKKKISILPRIGGGLNRWNGYGIITGGSISYGKIMGGKIGADLMYLVNTTKHTFGLTGFYERTILKFMILRGGLGYIKTGTESNIGWAVGVGISYSMGKILIIQPMIEIDSGSATNNIMGLNLSMGVSL